MLLDFKARSRLEQSSNHLGGKRNTSLMAGTNSSCVRSLTTGAGQVAQAQPEFPNQPQKIASIGQSLVIDW